MRGDFGGNTKMEGPASARLGGVWKAGAWLLTAVSHLQRWLPGGNTNLTGMQLRGLLRLGLSRNAVARAVNSVMNLL